MVPMPMSNSTAIGAAIRTTTSCRRVALVHPDLHLKRAAVVPPGYSPVVPVRVRTTSRLRPATSQDPAMCRSMPSPLFHRTMRQHPAISPTPELQG